MTEAQCKPDFERTKETHRWVMTYVVILCGFHLVENWQRYNGTALYLDVVDCMQIFF